MSLFLSRLHPRVTPKSLLALFKFPRASGEATAPWAIRMWTPGAAAKSGDTRRVATLRFDSVDARKAAEELLNSTEAQAACIGGDAVVSQSRQFGASAIQYRVRLRCCAAFRC